MYIKEHSKVTEGYKKMVLGFVIVTVMLVAIIFYFSASRAIIKIVPKLTPAQTDFVADVVTDGGQVTETTLQGMLFETEVEGSMLGEATGSKLLEGSSIGKVTIINNRSEAQSLVKTTRLLTAEGVLLHLADRVNVPAKGTAEVGVYADDTTTFTELGPTKFTIPGLSESLQKLVYAENKATLKSVGSSVKVVKAVDMARTKDKLTEELYNDAIAQFSTQLPNKNYTTIVVAKEVVADGASVEIDKEVDEFTVDLKLKVTLIGLDQNSIIELAGDRLKSIIPETQDLLSVDLSKFTYKVQNYDATAKTANIKVHIEGNSVIREDHEIFSKEKLSSLSPKGVELYLSNFDEVESVTVELKPFWVKKVPKLKDHIMIIVESPK